LCTDGFSRAVVDYAIFAAWDDLMHAVRDKGLTAVLAVLRSHEREHGKRGLGHFKESDDAAALLLTR
jgi:hypothetical protein